MATEPKGVVAVGASAGGVEALRNFAAGLPPDLPYPVMVVLHVASAAPSVLARIIDRSGPVPAVAAPDGALLEAGCIYVAVPNYHLLAHNHRVVLSDGPTENRHRPAINALFRSVALDYGTRTLGVLMSGLSDDGVAGLAAIKAYGGVTIVQEPSDALFPDLPHNAVEAGVADYTVAAGKIGDLLMQLTDCPTEEQRSDPDGRIALENRIALSSRLCLPFDTAELGPPSGFSCPDCSGTLMQVSGEAYRCRLGHAWTAEALLLAHEAELEKGVSGVIRSLEEKLRLSLQLAEKSRLVTDRKRYAALAEEAERKIRLVGETWAEPSAFPDATSPL